MSAEFPDMFQSHWRQPAGEICSLNKEWILRDWAENNMRTRRKAKQIFETLSFITPSYTGRVWCDKKCGVNPNFCTVDVEKEISRRLDFIHGRSPYVMNGVPISNVIDGCCINDHCSCRSGVIFYNGMPYDQKPYMAARLRTRSGDVMFLEGKLAPPFAPGKSPQIFGPYRNRDRYPQTMGFKENPFGRPLNPCCTTSIYNDTVPPYHNTNNYAFSRLGLPYGETLGYFRFKHRKICDPRLTPIKELGECCTCEPGEYNPAQYRQDECPGQPCCC